MNLKPTADDLAFRAEVRRFVRDNVTEELRERNLGLRRLEREDYVRWQKTLHARGWGAPAWPKEFGGTGWSALRRVIFEEECFEGGAPRQMPFGLGMIGPVLQRFGSPEQKAQHLPKILSADSWWCQGYSEPGAGSDLASLKARAVRRGDKYVIDGHKIWTSFAQWSDWMFCLVRTSTEGRPQEGISMLLMEMSTPGITVRPIRTLDGSHDINEIFLEGVEVPASNLVGEENRGWTYAKFLLGHERAGIAGIGMCKRLLLRLRDVARRERRRGRPIIEDPRFRDRVARVEMALIAHEWSLLRVVSGEDERRQPGPEASVLKLRATEIQTELGLLLMDCVGPAALAYDPTALDAGYAGPHIGPDYAEPLAGVFFDLHKVGIYGGTTEIQKNIVGKTLIGV